MILLCLEVTFAIIVGIISVFGAYWIYFKKNHFFVDKSIPFESQVPLIGTAMAILIGKKIHEANDDMYKKHGRIFGAYQGYTPVIYVAEPEILKSILVKDFSIFPTRREFKSGNPTTDNMISVLKGDEQWRNIRNTLTPAFSSGKLKKMVPLICDCANLLVENIEKYSEGRTAIDCKRLFGNYTLDVIANVAFGTQVNSHNDPDNKFVYHAKKVFSSELNYRLFLALIVPKFARSVGIEFFPSDTIQFFKDTTMAIVEQRKKTKQVRPDFLQLLINSLEEDTATNEPTDGVQNVDHIKRKPLTMDEFFAQTVIFFLAGYDTTATTLTALSYYFATNPETQKKAIDEVDRIWQGRQAIDADALSEAKYLSAAIDETLRLSPPAVNLDRTCVTDYQLGDTGITIPKGMLIQIPVFSMHHDAEFFPDPEAFKPERFLGDEKNTVANSYTYLPFGAGPRNCIAMRLALMEVKLCMVYVLRHFEFSPSSKTKIPMEYLNTGLLQPKDVFLHATKRRNA